MIEWTDQATRQLDNARDYIELSNSAEVADRITMRIVSAVQRLLSFPTAGRPGRVPRARELVIAGTPFIVAYTIDGPRLVVLTVYHGAHRWPERF